MSAFLSRAVLALSVALAAPAFAQEPPTAGGQSDVLVTGTPDREQEISDFVRALTPGTVDGVARFEESICPNVLGLSGPLKEAVLNRMREVIEAAGLGVAGGDCRPNVLLMVTRDKQALIEALAGRYPHFFDDQDNSARRVARQPGPASAWHAQIMVNAGGQALPMRGGFYVNQTGLVGGRIKVPTRSVFIAAAVVVERRALEGLSATQLADYALMRALARTEPHRLTAASPPSILSVLEAPMGSEIPLTLTRWDLGFLRGLNASTPNLRTAQQRGEIRRRVAAELDGTARN